MDHVARNRFTPAEEHKVNAMNLKRRVYLCLATLVCGLPGMVSLSAEEQGRVTVELEDNGQPLVNPEMGWTMHFYSNVISN